MKRDPHYNFTHQIAPGKDGRVDLYDQFEAVIIERHRLREAGLPVPAMSIVSPGTAL